MSRLVAMVCNDPDRLRCALEPVRPALLAKPDPVERPRGFAAWGIGLYQGGEVLLKRRPQPTLGPVDFFPIASELRTDTFIAHARSATVGAVLPAGAELFRLIRQGRLEWRAEVAAADLARLRPGLPAVVATPGGDTVRGVVRMIAPTVVPATRNGLVYVDLPAPGALRPGMVARGESDIGASAALTLPQGAVLLRDGFNYVMRLGPDAKVVQTKVETGRRVGDRVEITGGLAADAASAWSAAGPNLQAGRDPAAGALRHGFPHHAGRVCRRSRAGRWQSGFSLIFRPSPEIS